MKPIITSGKLYYTDGWKYILEEEWCCQTEIYPPKPIRYKNIRLTTKGLLTLTPGFPWNGPSGPTRDTPNSIAGSAAHDALYRLMRLGLLLRKWRKKADDVFYWILREKKMTKIRATVWYHGVRQFAKSATKAANRKQVLVAP